MKNRIFTLIFAVTLGLLALTSCKKDDDSICIAVDGYTIIVRNVYPDGYEVKFTARVVSGSQTTTYSYFDADYNHDGDVHHFTYTDIVFGSSSVTSVNVAIDNQNFSYPGDKCK